MESPSSKYSDFFVIPVKIPPYMLQLVCTVPADSIFDRKYYVNRSIFAICGDENVFMHYFCLFFPNFFRFRLVHHTEAGWLKALNTIYMPFPLE